MPLWLTLVSVVTKLRVTVHDTGNPEKVSTSTVRIPVTRNVNSPKFSRGSYEAVINENALVGKSIVQVSATDADKVRVHRILLH